MWKWLVHMPQNRGLIYRKKDLLAAHRPVMLPISSSGDKDQTSVFIMQYKPAPEMEQPNKQSSHGYSLF